jgi:hypothetical protein
MNAVECDPDAPPTAGPAAVAEELLLHVRGRLAGLPPQTRHRLLNALASGLAAIQAEALADPVAAADLPPFDRAARLGAAVTVAADGYYPNPVGDEFEVSAGETLRLRSTGFSPALVLTPDGIFLHIPHADLRMLPAKGGAA